MGTEFPPASTKLDWSKSQQVCPVIDLAAEYAVGVLVSNTLTKTVHDSNGRS